jgi:hypothetical protein
MRTRTRTTVQNWHSWSGVGGATSNIENWLACNNSSNTTPATFAGHNVALDQIIERMTDGLGKGTPHQVMHRKRVRNISRFDQADYVWPSVQAGQFGVVYDRGAGPYWYSFADSGVDYFCTFDTSSDVSLPKHWTINTSSFNESSLKAKTLENARQLKADVLLDIVEGNQIWPSIKSLALSLPKLSKQVVLNTRLHSVNPGVKFARIAVASVPLWNKVRPLIREASGSFLAWKFGIAPLLSDFVAIHKYMPKLVADVKRHTDGDTKRFSSKADAIASYDDSERAPTVLNGVTASIWTTQGRLVKHPEVRYVLVVKPNKSHYATDFFKKADTFMSRFATSPARLAWEKVPFSFVVDWFVDLKGTLDALDKMVGVTPYQVVSFTRSFSYQLATDVFFTRRSPCNGGILFDQALGSCDFCHYERKPIDASSPLIRWQPHFGKNQAAISAALIAQQLARIGRR